jgi:hypothetical protein
MRPWTTKEGGTETAKQTKELTVEFKKVGRGKGLWQSCSHYTKDSHTITTDDQPLPRFPTGKNIYLGCFLFLPRQKKTENKTQLCHPHSVREGLSLLHLP